MTNRKILSHLEFLVFLLVYASILAARNSDWLPQSWSFLPVVETAWLNFLLVLVLVCWLVRRTGGLASVGLKAPEQLRQMFRWVIIIMVVDTLAIGVATPVLVSAFGETQPTARFAEVRGNLPLLLMILPIVWLVAAFGEEIFFRGFVLTRLAGLLGAAPWAWAIAVVIQAVAFGAIHAYQGPVQMILIGIGGLVYGAAFVLLKKNLWPLILAHGVNDTVGFVLLYLGIMQA